MVLIPLYHSKLGCAFRQHLENGEAIAMLDN